MGSQNGRLRAAVVGRIVARIICTPEAWANHRPHAEFHANAAQFSAQIGDLDWPKFREQAKLTVFGVERRPNESGSHGRGRLSGVALV